MKKTITQITVLFLAISCMSYAHAYEQLPPINTQKIISNAPDINPKSLSYALKGYQWALRNTYVRNPNILTLIDFSLPSYEKRLWVINLKTGKTLMHLYTTQGKNSGEVYAKRFSNKIHSNQTSLGVYETLNPYQGQYGSSLRLRGLEPNINDNAYRRAIVIHPAWYASAKFIRANRRAGTSWGCFAIDPSMTKQLINLTKNGTIIFAYAPPMHRDPYITKI